MLIISSLFFIVVSSFPKAQTSSFIIWTSSQLAQRLYRRYPLLSEPGVQFNVRFMLVDLKTTLFEFYCFIFSKIFFLHDIYITSVYCHHSRFMPFSCLLNMLMNWRCLLYILFMDTFWVLTFYYIAFHL